jgi:predicted dehydrogenase
MATAKLSSFHQESNMKGKMNRRRFVQASAAAGIGYFAVADVTESRAARQNDPMNRLNIAIIGAGGQGGGNLGNVARENIVALCDVDSERAGGAFNKYPKVPKYQDYRVMLDKQKDIEAVVVSTPDHVHAFASIDAMKRGKHCYTEKPLTHSIWEARQMHDVAAKNRVATQMGNMGTAGGGFRTGVEIIRSGAIGDIREVHVWTNRPGMWWNQGMAKPLDRQPVPKTMAWDLWLGPAPERPYNSGYAPFAWRGWWDFGTGAVGDMGCHTMNLAYMSLELGAPTSVVAETDQPVNNQSPPRGLMVTYEFPARGKKPAVRLKWYEVRRPPADLLLGEKPGGSGSLFVGSRGTLYSPDDYGEQHILLPRKNFEGYKPPQPTLPRSPGHHAEWIRACKGGAPAMSNFVDYASQLTETILLGNVAIRVGKRIDWDPVNLRARDLSAADQYIHREYRKGWTI